MFFVTNPTSRRKRYAWNQASIVGGDDDEVTIRIKPKGRDDFDASISRRARADRSHLPFARARTGMRLG